MKDFTEFFCDFGSFYLLRGIPERFHNSEGMKMILMFGDQKKDPKASSP